MMMSKTPLIRIKLISLWWGPLPEWLPQFRERMKAQEPLVTWELVVMSPEDVRARVWTQAGYFCNKEDGYSMCDLRPAFGEVFADKFKGFDFWGWCDLDVVFGNMSTFLTEDVLSKFDIISGASYCTDGPFTILHNSYKTCELYRGAEFQRAAADSRYHNFDETGHFGAHDPAGFTNVAISRNARYLFGDWSSHDRHKPPRECEFFDGRLYEMPSGREIGYYHFPRSKSWPL